MDKHIVKIEELVDYEHVQILTSSTENRKQITQKTMVRKVAPGRHEIINIIYVMRLGKVVTSTAHLSLAVNIYNKI
jgi:hypothetical protein